MTDKKILFLLPFFVLLLTNIACGQYIKDAASSAIKVNVEKKDCENKNVKTSKLIISLKKGNVEKISKANNYGLTEFIGLNDSIKLRIVEKLLQFRDDTTLVCINVSNYGYQGYENTCNIKPETKQYSIQVEALYIINKLCFPHASSFYYCYPVLFDTLTGKEINRNYSAIKEVFEIYEKWFMETKFKEQISKDFPFNGGRYIWYGGRKN